MYRALAGFAVCFGFIAPCSAADWQPAKGPLMTKWAKDVAPDKVHPEYPRPQMVREEWLNLNGVWQFAEAKEGEQPPIGKELEGRILVPFPVESALSGVMKPVDRVWYRRTFKASVERTGHRMLLHFGASNWETTVWVNGKKLGAHRGGYDAFSFDITDAIKEGGTNELVVGVWNPVDSGTQPRGKQVRKPGGIYYTASTGIWQTVWIEPVSPDRIESIKIVPDVDTGKVRITAGATGDADELRVSVLDPVTKEVVARATGPAGKELEFTVPRPKLWSPESPFLYDVKVLLANSKGKPVDIVMSYFGMRKVSIGKDEKGVTRILLNDKPYFMVGLLDQGFWPDGLYTAPTDEALKYDIEITKKLGFNSARKHVKVEPARWYYRRDKLGLLVWQDMPSGDKNIAPDQPDIERTPESARQFRLELKRMIDGLHNHPSIVMWVPFNEGWGQFDTEKITHWTNEYDPTRLVNSTSGWSDRKVGDVFDMHAYPGPGSPTPEPTRAAVLGEFGGLGLPVQGHMWSKEGWGYQGVRDSAHLTRRYEKLLQGVRDLREKPGLSAAIYTQTTDVETEANGLLTYDRSVIKVDVDRIAAVNRGDFSRMAQVKTVVPTSQEKAQTWRYMPAWQDNSWHKPEYDDSKWKEGPGGFGTKGTPGAIVRTEWNTRTIYLRRTFELPEDKLSDPELLIHHDENVEVYINGVLATKLTGFVTSYQEVPISPAAEAALKPGRNVLAVHCRQTTGGQYIDVGIIDVVKP